ncbi:MAG: hypothetical protein COB02_13185 [Candidatus Cloacimonadota bacterium]|nr:MAG: hypothetical protein COB02_13185 [Candidatus Cloacimonadota bacterium]
MNFKRLEKNIVSVLESRLSSGRLSHIFSVSRMAYDLAKYFNLDCNRHKILGLLHDLCKEEKRPLQKKIIQKYYSNDLILLENSALYHAKTSYFEAQKLFSLSSEFLSPILWHTTGKSCMSLDDKVLYISDYIEPLRPWYEDSFLQDAKDDIDKLLLKILVKKISYTMKNNKQVHPDSLDCYNYLVLNKV